MNIYRKICVVFSNFVKKIIGGINFRKKRKKNRKCTSFYLLLKSKEVKQGINQGINQGIENKMVTQNIFVKSKIRFS